MTPHTATILPDGRVLVAGGADAFGVARSLTEIYDPVSGTWAMTGNLAAARQFHSATLLVNGKVLVTGGVGGGGNPVASCGTFRSGYMGPGLSPGISARHGTSIPRRYCRMAKCMSPEEKVREADCWPALSFYDPGTGAWTSAGNMVTPRRSHTATLLPDGRVFLCQGFSTGNIELYDPNTGSYTSKLAFAATQYARTATLLPNGKVLLAGGQSNSSVTAAANLFNPANNSISSVDNMTTARRDHTATLLPDGKVLVAGGRGSNGAVASAELYDPATGSWSATGPLQRNILCRARRCY